MNTKKTFQLKDWDDFEVFHNESKISDAHAYYESYLKFIEILEKLPKSELVKRGWMNSKNDLASLVPLFQNIHSNSLSGLFRKSDTSNVALCSAWQTNVASKAKLLVMMKRISDFKGIDKKELRGIAQLSPDESIIEKLPDILEEKGIILIYERALPGMKLDGVVFNLESGHPVIGISFRFKRIDNFWFTLLHELAHIKLHFEHLHNPIFDDMESDEKDALEIQANRFAKDSVVERWKWRNCEAKYNMQDNVVIDFADNIGIHPAIIAGMLQKELNSYNIFRKIVDKTDIRREIFGDE